MERRRPDHVPPTPEGPEGVEQRRPVRQPPSSQQVRGKGVGWDTDENRRPPGTQGDLLNLGGCCCCCCGGAGRRRCFGRRRCDHRRLGRRRCCFLLLLLLLRRPLPASPPATEPCPSFRGCESIAGGQMRTQKYGREQIAAARSHGLAVSLFCCFRRPRRRE